MADSRHSSLQLCHPRHWPAWLGIAVMRLISMLPLPVIRSVGGVLGTLLYYLHSSRRRIATINVSRCFPELNQRTVKKIVKRHFRSLGQALLDVGLPWWSSLKRLRRLVRMRGREHYDRALEQGQNIILMAPHFLGIEVGGMRISMERPVVAMFRHPTNPVMRHVMEQGRMRCGARLIEHNREVKTMVKQIRAGKPLYYSPDQDAGFRNSAFVPFFGIPTATFTVIGRLVKMADAVVIPCITRQLTWGRGYEMTFLPPLPNIPSGDPVADATVMNKAIEDAARETPEQYFWVHKRFKTRPKGEKDFYAR